MDFDVYLLPRIIEFTPLNILVTQTDGTIWYHNRCATMALGYDSGAIINAKVDGFVAGAEGGIAWAEVFNRVVAGEQFETRLNLVCKGGNEVPCQVYAFKIVATKYYPDTLVFIFRDISREVRAMRQLDKKNLEMAKMNSELIRSNAELKRVSETKSNFLGIASHELKTPLTSIKGYSDIIIDSMRGKMDPATFRMIESISRAADRLHRVVNNILDVTRIEQKRLRLKPENLDLPALVKESIEELTQFSTPRNIQFRASCEKDLPPCYADRMRMQQVFTNLFSNAIKYSPNNSLVEVRIYLEEQDHFHILVKDQGIGIDIEEQKKIFFPFYEVGNINRHSSDMAKFMGGGTGLGLSIVKGIVERHGGRIWVVSEGVKPNQYPGSEFHIVIPSQHTVAWDDDETKSILLAKDSDGQVNPVDLDGTATKPTILLIDGDREAVEIASLILEKAFDVLVAESGEAGLTLAFSRRPSLVLLDAYLPGIDGYRICRILRSQEETRTIPIAFFSAGTQQDEIQKCFSVGADDFIVKPFSGKELVEKIWRILMKKKEADQMR
jgi:two-component system, sensor histidine kinase ChiS